MKSSRYFCQAFYASVILVLVFCSSSEGENQNILLAEAPEDNACPYGWTHGAGQCYKLYSAANNIKSAMEVCARQNSSLANVRTWEQSDFLSKFLASYPEIHEWHIGGRMRNGRWHWYTTAETYWPASKSGKKSGKTNWRFLFKQSPVTENKWFPGWTTYDFQNQEPQAVKKSCMVLSNQFKAPGRGEQPTDYFYWKTDWCMKKEGFHFICQKPPKEAGGLFDDGCKWGEFMCHSGQCIKGYNKCDLKVQCDDYSDELDCPRELQLVNGPVPYEGRVQMMLSGTDITGSVCGENFDDRDAQVVCRALGFILGGKALKAGSYGYDNGVVWMDRVSCNGHENTLDECPYRDHESHTCDHSKDAAVRCYVPPDDIVALKPDCSEGSGDFGCSCKEDEFQCRDETCIPMAAKCDGEDHCRDGSDEDGCTQLVGGPDGSMGKLVVEMYGENHRFCSDSLGDREASVVCKELGYQLGGVSTNMTFLDTGETPLEYNFHCEGTEKRFVECGVTSAKTESCNLSDLAGVRCLRDTEILALPDPDVDFKIPISSKKVDVRMCEDISSVTQALWDSDTDRLPVDSVQLNYQAELDGFWEIQDESPDKLFNYVNESQLTSPVYTTFLALLDNYDPYKSQPELPLPQELTEEDTFLETIMETKTMKVLYNYLACKGKIQDMTDLQELLRRHWFDLYPRSGKSYVLDTSGFEHMVGEFKSSHSVDGMHSWLSFYLKEKGGKLNYYGHSCVIKPNTACPAFEWQGRIKRKATFFLRSSPAYDIAIYSLCFSLFRNEHCPIVVDGEKMIIKTHGKGGHIASAYIM